MKTHTETVRLGGETYRVQVSPVEPGVQSVRLGGEVIAYATRAGGGCVRVERTLGDYATRVLPSAPLALYWAVKGAVA